MRIVVIGAGSLRILPALLSDLFVDMPRDCALSLVDPDLPMAELMGHVARAWAAQSGVQAEVRVTTERRDVLRGAELVLFAAAVLGEDAWQADRELLQKAQMNDQIRDSGGLSGLLYTLRGAGLALDVCADMRALCPNAWLLCMADPLARIVTAARQAGIRAVGYCESARMGETEPTALARLLSVPAQRLRVVTAGLHHLGWLVSAMDTQSGEELLPRAMARVADGAWGILPKRWLDFYGGVMMGDPAHHADWMPTQSDLPLPQTAPLHRNEEARTEQIQWLVQTVIHGRTAAFDQLMRGRIWERPGRVARALCGEETLCVTLNLPNAGSLPQLPPGAIVEVPARIHAGEILPLQHILLPEGVAGLCAAVSETHVLAARAAAGDRTALREAIEIDPALAGCDRLFAQEVVARMMQANAPLLPHFSQEDA